MRSSFSPTAHPWQNVHVALKMAHEILSPYKVVSANTQLGATLYLPDASGIINIVNGKLQTTRDLDPLYSLFFTLNSCQQHALSDELVSINKALFKVSLNLCITIAEKEERGESTENEIQIYFKKLQELSVDGDQYCDYDFCDKHTLTKVLSTLPQLCRQMAEQYSEQSQKEKIGSVYREIQSLAMELESTPQGSIKKINPAYPGFTKRLERTQRKSGMVYVAYSSAVLSFLEMEFIFSMLRGTNSHPELPSLVCSHFTFLMTYFSRAYAEIVSQQFDPETLDETIAILIKILEKLTTFFNDSKSREDDLCSILFKLLYLLMLRTCESSKNKILTQPPKGNARIKLLTAAIEKALHTVAQNYHQHHNQKLLDAITTILQHLTEKFESAKNLYHKLKYAIRLNSLFHEAMRLELEIIDHADHLTSFQKKKITFNDHEKGYEKIVIKKHSLMIAYTHLLFSILTEIPSLPHAKDFYNDLLKELIPLFLNFRREKRLYAKSAPSIVSTLVANIEIFLKQRKSKDVTADFDPEAEEACIQMEMASRKSNLSNTQEDELLKSGPQLKNPSYRNLFYCSLLKNDKYLLRDELNFQKFIPQFTRFLNFTEQALKVIDQEAIESILPEGLLVLLTATHIVLLNLLPVLENYYDLLKDKKTSDSKEFKKFEKPFRTLQYRYFVLFKQCTTTLAKYLPHVKSEEDFLKKQMQELQTEITQLKNNREKPIDTPVILPAAEAPKAPTPPPIVEAPKAPTPAPVTVETPEKNAVTVPAPSAIAPPKHPKPPKKKKPPISPLTLEPEKRPEEEPKKEAPLLFDAFEEVEPIKPQKKNRKQKRKSLKEPKADDKTSPSPETPQIPAHAIAKPVTPPPELATPPLKPASPPATEQLQELTPAPAAPTNSMSLFKPPAATPEVNWCISDRASSMLEQLSQFKIWEFIHTLSLRHYVFLTRGTVRSLYHHTTPHNFNLIVTTPLAKLMTDDLLKNHVILPLDLHNANCVTIIESGFTVSITSLEIEEYNPDSVQFNLYHTLLNFPFTADGGALDINGRQLLFCSPAHLADLERKILRASSEFNPNLGANYIFSNLTHGTYNEGRALLGLGIARREGFTISAATAQAMSYHIGHMNISAPIVATWVKCLLFKIKDAFVVFYDLINFGFPVLAPSTVAFLTNPTSLNHELRAAMTHKNIATMSQKIVDLLQSGANFHAAYHLARQAKSSDPMPLTVYQEEVFPSFVYS